MKDDIILSELDDDELVQQMHDDLYDGLQDEIREGVRSARPWVDTDDVLTKALVEGMTIVGIDFRTVSCSFPRSRWPPTR